MFQTYLTVRLAPASVKYCKGARGISATSIKAALKAGHPVEFICALTGRWLTVAEAREAGVRSLSVRYNDDRSVAVIPC